MFAGAVVGAELVLHGQLTAALGVAVGVLFLVGLGAVFAATETPAAGDL